MYRTIQWGLALAVLLGICASLQTASAAVIGGWDLARGGLSSVKDAPGQAGTRALISAISPGATLTASNTLTGAYLSSIDVLLIGGQTADAFGGFITALSPSEQAALFNFVSAGGNAAIVTEREPQGGPGGDAVRESLIDPFGMDTTGDSHAPTATFINALHPIAHGPFGNITQFGLNGSGWYNNLGPYAISIATDDFFNQPVLAVIEHGAISPTSGRVVFLADGNALDAGSFHSLALAGNTLSYLIPVPEPSSASLALMATIGLVGVCYRRARRFCAAVPASTQ
jgi:PEP-CTERM motif